jgi:tetratricopeptide (TPR) repeat protein
MIRKLSVGIAGLSVVAGLFSGCKQTEPLSESRPSVVQLESPQFQTESQFVVHAIVSDLAEQIYFARFHRLPIQKRSSVVVTETGGTKDAPVYALQIRLDPKMDVRLELKMDGPIWSSEVYRSTAQRLAEAVRLRASVPRQTEDTTLLTKLLDAKPETIEQQNQAVSKALETDFSNAQLHENAALLLGAFVIRDHSGNFFEIRSPLSRLTAHLVMAQFLRGTNALGTDGEIAEAMMLTMVNNQAAALGRLSNVNTNSVGVAAMVRGLRARNTGDYRPLAAETNRSPFESIQWFYAEADRIDVMLAWLKLSDEQRQKIDYVRIANDLGPTVEVGNELDQKAIPLELEEIENIYLLVHSGQTMPPNIGTALNVLPGHCFETDAGGKIRVQVIDWGQWSMFFQRQLCHSVEQGFHFVNSMLGDPEGAKEFAARSDKSFGNLTLYPFVRRFDATETEEYHKAVDDGFKLTALIPQFVPASCWNALCAPVSFGPTYSPNPNPRISEWHNHNPLPGTVYDLLPRLSQSSLTNRADIWAKCEELRKVAPYNIRLSRFVLNTRYNGFTSYDEVMALYRDVLPYSPIAMRAVAMGSLSGDVQKYEELMTRAAEIDPWYYYELGEYEFNMNNFTREDKAAEYYQKGYDADPDRVGASHHAEWLVKYWLKHQRTAKAAEIADEAGGVYSEAGLCAQAIFREATSNYNGAFESLKNIEERYNDAVGLLNFCFRYKAKTGDSRFESEVQKRVGTLFTNGIENVSLGDFKSPPTDGVAFRGDSYLMFKNGLSMSNVIVAVYGVRVHNVAQYTFGRNLKDTPELDLIVWQGDAYRELRPNLPGHLFGADIGNYSPQW